MKTFASSFVKCVIRSDDSLKRSLFGGIVSYHRMEYCTCPILSLVKVLLDGIEQEEDMLYSKLKVYILKTQV